jgi:NTE family protein
MRGGGTKGAYEVGALKAMADMLEPIDIAYDVLAGVSIGALNAAMFATFERG